MKRALLAAWNAGEAPVRRYGGLPPIDETHAHVQRVLKLYWGLLQQRLGLQARGLVLPPRNRHSPGLPQAPKSKGPADGGP